MRRNHLAAAASDRQTAIATACMLSLIHSSLTYSLSPLPGCSLALLSLPPLSVSLVLADVIFLRCQRRKKEMNEKREKRGGGKQRKEAKRNEEIE